MKNLSRRSFARTTGIAIAGVVTGIPGRLFGGTAETGQAATTDAVMNSVLQYANRARLCGAAAVSHRIGQASPLTSIIAEVSDRAALEGFYQRAVAGRGKSPSSDRFTVSGNEYTFESGGSFYSVRNLPSETFSKTIDALQRGEDGFFHHETLTESSLKGASATDQNTTYAIRPLPHKTVNRTNAASAFRSWFDASIAAQAYGLEMSNDAAQLGATVCGSPATADAAAGTVEDVIERVAYASEMLDSRTLRSLLATRFVDESFRLATGRSSKRISQAFQKVCRNFRGHSQSSVWLALLVGNSADGGALHRAVTSSNPLYARSTRAAKMGTMEILQSNRLANLGFSAPPIQIQAWDAPNVAEAPFRASLSAPAHDPDEGAAPAQVEYVQGTDPIDLGKSTVSTKLAT